ncbi:MAG: thioredoxin family protein [bacterium]
MRVEILGSGCRKCEALYEQTKRAAAELGLECTLEKVTDVEAIVGRGVMATPALVVDGKVKVAGRVPSTSQIKEMLS